MADFEEAVNFVLANEGGYVNNPNDPGGETNFGISQKFLEKYNRAAKKITKEEAIFVYKKFFWEDVGYESIEEQKICNYIFDMAVNHGKTQAIKITQRALWPYFSGNLAYIVDDGILGSRTMLEINHQGINLKYTLQSERAGFYRLLVALEPSRKEFLNGWLNRCYRI